MFVGLFVCRHVHGCRHVCMYVGMFMFVGMSVCMYVYVCRSVRMAVCICL